MSRFGAVIQERGNGFCDAGEYVAGDDSNVYLVVEIVGQIQTGRSSGAPNFVQAIVEPAEWDDIDDDNEPYCSAVVDNEHDQVSS